MSAPKSKSPQAGASGKSQAGNNSEQNEFQVKKVAPYPISIQIIKVEGQPPLRGQIVKLTDFGFLMKVDSAQYYKVGENYKVRFDLPVLGEEIESAAKVVKTYDAMETYSKENASISRTIEMHFINLDSTNRSKIHSYLVKSGQR